MPKNDIFAPLDILNQMAPHNVVASILTGGQIPGDTGNTTPSSGQGKTGGAQLGAAGRTSGVGGQGAGAGGTSSGQGTSTSGAKVASVSVSGPIGARPSAGAGHGTIPDIKIKIPQTTKVIVTDSQTKLPVPNAAIYYDQNNNLGVTDPQGTLSTESIPAGNHTITVDALGYDLYTQDIYVSQPSGAFNTKVYNVSIKYLGDLPTDGGIGGGNGGGNGGGIGGGNGGGNGGGTTIITTPPTYTTPPSYEAPSYGAPSYGAPSYGGPSYGGPSGQAPSGQAPAGLPMPPLEWLQQFLLLPFTTIQTIFSAPLAMPQAPMTQGGRCGRR
jgi:hypothetical protein